MRATPPPLIVRRAGGLEAGEAPWRRTAFRTRGFFPSRRERTRRFSAYQPAVEARNRTAAPRDRPPPRGPRSEPTWSFRRSSPAPARMRRRSGNWRSARKIPDPPPTARVPRGRPWSSMLQNSSRQPAGLVLNRHYGLPSTLQRTSRLTEARPALPPKAGHARGDLDTPFGATRRHRVPPRAGEVHVASSRSRKPLSVHLGECALVLAEKRRETSSISASRRRRCRIAGAAATRMGARISDAADRKS